MTTEFGKLRLADLRPGDVLVADGGFTCVADGAELIVEADDRGFFFRCAGGVHRINGQLKDGFLVGLRHRDTIVGRRPLLLTVTVNMPSGLEYHDLEGEASCQAAIGPAVAELLDDEIGPNATGWSSLVIVVAPK